MKSLQGSKILAIIKNVLGWEHWRDAAAWEPAADGAGCSLPQLPRPPGLPEVPPCPTAGLCPLLSLFKSLIRELRCSQPALEVPRYAWASSSEQLLLISGFDPIARVSWKCLSSWWFGFFFYGKLGFEPSNFILSNGLCFPQKSLVGNFFFSSLEELNA